MTSASQRLHSRTSGNSEFAYSGRHRVFEAIEAVPFMWPTKSEIANDYITGWRELAGEILGGLSLSRKTAFCIASHISRRDGVCQLTDKALAARSGRSLASTKRDIQRLKLLGLLIAEYERGDVHQERVRALKIAVPERGRSSPRPPSAGLGEVVSTCPPHVEPLDIGEPLNV